jgi:hypothetical protein
MKTNGIEDPGTNPHNYSHLSFDKGAQNIHWKKDTFSTNGVGKTGNSHVAETIFKSLVDQNLEIRPQNVKLPKERTGKTLELEGTTSKLPE